MVSPLCTQRLEGIQELVLFNATFILNFSILNLTFSIVALVGNLLVISALWKASSIPSTLRKLFINLAFSDLAVGLIPQLTFGVINATMLKMVASENHNFDIFCPIIFTFYNFSAFLLASASFFTVTTMALDRFLAIYLHLRYHELVTSNRVTAVLAVFWLTSGLCATVFITILRYAYVTVAVEVFGLNGYFHLSFKSCKISSKYDTKAMWAGKRRSNGEASRKEVVCQCFSCLCCFSCLLRSTLVLYNCAVERWIPFVLQSSLSCLRILSFS